MFTAALTLAACSPAPPETREAAPLPHLGVRSDGLTVSGISSGAYMAGQYQFAHSATVTGAAIIAGGPYGCAESVYADVIPGPGTAFLNLSKAVNGCMRNALKIWGVPDPDGLARKALRRADQDKIDPIDGVRNDRVYLFTGGKDTTVVPAIVGAAARFYTALGIPDAALKTVTDAKAGHAFLTETFGTACGASSEPYIADCDYDQAGALLDHLIGPLNPPSLSPFGKLETFDQRPMTQTLSKHGLDDTGFVYVPNACREAAGCRVHISYHGCGQNRDELGRRYPVETGFQRWADTNRLVVLFPQTSASPMNPEGCWDWWGYTGNDYLTRTAPQIVAVTEMVAALAMRPDQAAAAP